MAGGWRGLQNELHNLYALSNMIRVIELRRMRWVGPVACMGEMRNVYNILVGKHERKRLLGRPRHRWVDNSRMDVREVEWEGVYWIHLVQGRDQWQTLVNTVMNLHAP